MFSALLVRFLLLSTLNLFLINIMMLNSFEIYKFWREPNILLFFEHSVVFSRDLVLNLHFPQVGEYAQLCPRAGLGCRMHERFKKVNKSLSLVF